MEIRVQNVGRIDSNIYDLNQFEIMLNQKITMEVALDVIDCLRRGGKLSRGSVHKILKSSYWVLKKMENVRRITLKEEEGREEGREGGGGGRGMEGGLEGGRGGGREGWVEDEGGKEEGEEEGEEQSKVVVCGDLHGQFFDLLYILDLNGVPSEKTRYLFNGR